MSARPALRQSTLNFKSERQSKKDSVADSQLSLLVTLKLPIEKKQQHKRPTKSISTSNHPFFKEIFNKCNNNTYSKQASTIPSTTTSILYPPPIKHFKVYSLSPDESSLLSHYSNVDLSKPSSSIPISDPILPNLSLSNWDFLLFYTTYKDTIPKPQPQFVITNDSISNLKTINDKYNHIKFDDRFNKFFDPIYINETVSNNHSQWCDLYKPLNHLQSLQSAHISTDIYNWLVNSFSKLKSVNQLKRREKLLLSSKNKNKCKKNTKINDPLDSFIVYDLESDYDYESDSGSGSNYNSSIDIVPCLIINGPIGCGKTSMIHSIINDELNGFVFEFNSNQSRAKKDLEFHLKQIGTTSMIKKENNSSFNNDKTVILFDDVDLIDNENLDKDFWLGLTDLLTYSYRPVILITSNLNKIPVNIVNESTIYNLDKIPLNTLFQYLDLISLSRNLNIDEKILDYFATLDLRKSLMQLQLFSYYFNISNMGLTNITLINDKEKKKKNSLTIIDKLNQIELSYYYGNQDTFNQDTFNESTFNFTNDINPYNNIDPIIQFNDDKYSCLEFYSSKYFSNGSRSRICRYNDALHYNKKHPSNSFITLSNLKLSTEIFGFIRQMAKCELKRATHNNPRYFDLHPMDIFDSLPF